MRTSVWTTWGAFKFGGHLVGYLCHKPWNVLFGLLRALCIFLIMFEIDLGSLGVARCLDNLAGHVRAGFTCVTCPIEGLQVLNTARTPVVFEILWLNY